MKTAKIIKKRKGTLKLTKYSHQIKSDNCFSFPHVTIEPKMLLQFKRVHGATWELIFFHDMSTGETFNDSSALFFNGEKMFSIIVLINNHFRNNNYFEYMLEFPEHKGYNRWKQTIDIASTNKAQKGSEIGFKSVHLDFPSGFTGLSRTTENSFTVFDGSPGVLGYWFSIGAKTGFNNPYLFAGVPSKNSKICYLWIRVPQRALGSCKQKKTSTQNFSLFFISIIYS